MSTNQLLSFFPLDARITSIRPNQRVALDEIWKAIEAEEQKVTLCAPTGSGKCLYIGSNIHTSRGLMLPSDLNTDDSIIGYNCTTNCIESSTVIARTPNELKSVIKITTRQGYELICTPEHKILIYDGAFKWKEAKDIASSDIIPINRTNRIISDSTALVAHEYKKPIQASNLNETITSLLPLTTTENLAYFLGLVIGNGAIYDSYIRLTFNSKDTDLVSFVLQYGKSLGLSPTFKKGYGGRDAIDVFICSTILMNWLSTNGFKKDISISKVIPYFVLKSSSSIQCSFLKGLFDTDGHVGKSNIEYSTSSKVLGEQTHQLLLLNGIISHRIARITHCRNKPFTSWRITVSGDNARRFNQLIGFGAIRKQHALGLLINRPTNPNLDTVPFIKAHIQSLHNNLVNSEYNKNRSVKANSGIDFVKFSQDCINNGTTEKTMGAYRQNQTPQNPSYNSLDKILKIYEPVANCESYKYLYNLNTTHFYYDSIRSIEFLKNPVLVCDLEVPLINSFIANGFIVHNSKIAETVGRYEESLGKSWVYTSPLNSLVDQTEATKHPESHICTVKGKRYYPCVAKGLGAKADDGYCAKRICYLTRNNPKGARIKRECQTCRLPECKCRECQYKSKMKSYINSKAGNTNSSLWLLGIVPENTSVLVIDECDSLEYFVRLNNTVTLPFHLKGDDFEYHINEINTYADAIEQCLDCEEYDCIKNHSRHEAHINAIRNMVNDYYEYRESWVIRKEISKSGDQRTKYEPVLVNRFVDPLLEDLDFVLAMSATPVKLPNSTFIEVKSSFPKEIRPWRFNPLGKMTYDNREQTIPRLAAYLATLKGKTIVHCRGYKGIANKLADSLRSLGMFPLLQSQDTSENPDEISRYDAIQGFIDAKDPNKILLSVAMGRGIDLWQPGIVNNIIAAIPWDNPKDELTIARKKVLGANYQADESQRIANEIMQMYGRVNRNANKVTNTEIIALDFNCSAMFPDKQFWFARNKGLFREWFLESEVK